MPNELRKLSDKALVVYILLCLGAGATITLTIGAVITYLQSH